MQTRLTQASSTVNSAKSSSGSSTVSYLSTKDYETEDDVLANNKKLGAKIRQSTRHEPIFEESDSDTHQPKNQKITRESHSSSDEDGPTGTPVTIRRDGEIP